MTLKEVQAMLARECEKAGSQAAWAERHGVTQGYVSAVILGRKLPSRGILAALGLERVVMYRRVRNV